MEYVTYDSLFLFATFVVGLIGLIVEIIRDKRKK